MAKQADHGKSFADFGGSRHFTDGRDWFVNYDTYVSSEVLVGRKDFKIEGKGNV